MTGRERNREVLERERLGEFYLRAVHLVHGKLLGIFNKFGNTPRAFEIIGLQRLSAKFTHPDIENALTAWRAGQGGTQ